MEHKNIQKIFKSFMSQKLIAFLILFFTIINFSLFLNHATGELQEISDVLKPNQSINLTTEEQNNPQKQSVLNKIKKDDIELDINDFIIEKENNNSLIESVDNSQESQDTLSFQEDSNESTSNNTKKHISTFLKPAVTKLNLTRQESKSPQQQSVLNKILADGKQLTLDDVFMTFTTAKHLVASSQFGSKKVKGSVIFTYITVELDQISSYLKDKDTKVILTTQESQDPQKQSVLDKVKKASDTQIKLDDITITLIDGNKKLKVAAKTSSETLEGEVEFSKVSITKSLSNYLKDKDTKVILTSQESQDPQKQSVLDKVKKASDTQIKLDDITITLIDGNKKLKIAAKTSSETLEGEVEFSKVSITKSLSNYLKDKDTKVILTSQESQDPQKQSVLDKVKKASDTQIKLDDITITLTDGNKKLKVAAKTNSEILEGEVEFSKVSITKALSGFLKDKDTKIILTSQESQGPQKQSVLDKIKKDADTQIKLDDITITLTDGNKKLKVAAKTNSEILEGEVEFSNVNIMFNNCLEDIFSSDQRNLGELNERSPKAIRKALLNKNIPGLTKEQIKNLKIELIEGENQADISSSDFKGFVRLTFTFKTYIGLILFIIATILFIIIMFLVFFKKY
ncbi:Hypothetical Protein MCAP [Strawberry lethal yellows phytoplasma (CPA) str. NZSb11]|uniref:Uncharacterized protein n=2 Tax=Phytoplasma australiense TaxID=59748 RepID=R4S074_PHYAS|nr:Hypothetical Protein MCAP [Strawberry lethal yellows phytoplasma (CPA) str. NZSb11]